MFTLQSLKVVVCEHRLVTLSLKINKTLKSPVSLFLHLLLPVPNKPCGFCGREAPCLLSLCESPGDQEQGGVAGLSDRKWMDWLAAQLFLNSCRVGALQKSVIRQIRWPADRSKPNSGRRGPSSGRNPPGRARTPSRQIWFCETW